MFESIIYVKVFISSPRDPLGILAYSKEFPLRIKFGKCFLSVHEGSVTFQIHYNVLPAYKKNGEFQTFSWRISMQYLFVIRVILNGCLPDVATAVTKYHAVLFFKFTPNCTFFCKTRVIIAYRIKGGTYGPFVALRTQCVTCPALQSTY